MSLRKLEMRSMTILRLATLFAHSDDKYDKYWKKGQDVFRIVNYTVHTENKQTPKR